MKVNSPNLLPRDSREEAEGSNDRGARSISGGGANRRRWRSASELPAALSILAGFYYSQPAARYTKRRGDGEILGPGRSMRRRYRQCWQK